MNIAQKQMQDAIHYLLRQMVRDDKLRYQLEDTEAYRRLVTSYASSVSGADGIEALGDMPEKKSPYDVIKLVWDEVKADRNKTAVEQPMDINDYHPSPDLYMKVRAGFVAHGFTFHGWCRKHGINPTNARAALVGVWDGKKGRALRARIIEDSGLKACL